MSKLLQLRGGTTAEHTSFTGAVREVTVDTDKDTLVIHDGATAGGHVLPRTKADIDALNINADTLDGKQLATIESEYQAFANTAAANVVDSAPGTLDTLNELAAALGDDANFSTTVTNSIATKMPIAGGTFTGDITRGGTVISDGAISDTGTFTLDVAGELILDADTSGVVRLKDGGTEYGTLFTTASNFYIKSQGNDKDIIFQGNDSGGSGFTALTLDMSAAGRANFNAGASFQDHVNFGDNSRAVFGNSDDLSIYHDASHSWIKDTGTGNLKISAGNFEVVGAADTNSAFIYGIEGGSLYLYHNGTQKLQTTSSGITVSGTLDINTNDAAGNTIDIIGEGSTNGAAICTNWNTGNAYLDFRLGGLTTANTEMRLYSGGDLHVDGNVIAYSTTISDERLKTDIVKIDSALDKVDQINGYTFTYTTDGKKSAGVIAQEVEKVLPSAITESTLPLKMGDDDKTEYKTVQYDQLIGLLVEAVKELKAEVAELKGK